MPSPKIRFKRSSVPNRAPSVDDLPLGEIAINTADGEVYIARERVGFGTDIIRVGAGATVTNILYVTKDGNDDNTGKKLGDAKRTIKGAVADSFPGTVIKVSAGIYLEDNPIVLPNNVSIVGDSLREVTVTPQNRGDLFWLDNSCYIAEMSFIGPPNPGGAIVTFNPEVIPYIDQSPYIQNCTNFIPGTIGLNINGKHAIGPIKSMVLDSYTQINPGGLGARIFNEAFAQLVSMFTICSDTAILCQSGGACDLTNSNSSFGNFGLIADGVSPLKYIGEVSSDAGIDASIVSINIDANAPEMNVVDCQYDHISGIATFVVDQEHNLTVGMGVTISGLGFVCPSDGNVLELTYPSGKYGYVFEARTVAPGRYVDASESIRTNKTEIQDKSLASIALYHPDFTFPDEDITNPSSRFYDSYRLIQQNKQEIIDRSLAQISVDHPDFVFPNDTETNPKSRFFDSYRLIQQNKQEIIDRSLAQISIEYPDFYFPDTSRSRFKDSYNLINSNRDEIIDKSLATISLYHPNFFFPDDDETNERSRFFDSYRLIQNNKQEIVDKSLAAISLNYDQYPNFFFPGDEETNERSRFFDSYRLIQQNKQEIIDKSIGNIVVNYEQYPSDWAFPGDDIINTRSRYYDSYRLIQKNKEEIVDTAWNAAVLQYPSISSTEDKCKRDLGFFVDAISTDILTSGNSYSQDFAQQYFVNGSPLVEGLVGEEVESVFAFTEARELMKQAITNQLTFTDLSITADPITGINTSTSSCADVQSNIDNLVSIVNTAILDGNLDSLGVRNSGIFVQTGLGNTVTPGGYKCARDIGFLVDAVSTDVFTGGNVYSREFILQYFDQNGDPLLEGLYEEEIQSLNAFIALGDLSKKAITNQLNFKDVGISSGPQTYGGVGSPEEVLLSGNPNACLDVQDNIDTLIGIVTSVVGLGTTATVGDVTGTINLGIFTQTGVASTIVPGGYKCARDIGFLVDAVSTDLFVGGNGYSRDFTLQYFDVNGNPISNGLVGEESQSILAFQSSADYMQRAVTNQLNRKDLGISSGTAYYAGIGVSLPVLISGNAEACLDVQDNIDNLVGIITSVVGLGTTSVLPGLSTGNFVINTDPFTKLTLNSSLSSVSPGGSKCARDIGYLVDAVATDVFTGGNNYSINFTSFYFDGDGNPNSDALVGEEVPSVVSFISVGDYSKKAITNQLNFKDVGISSGPQTYGGLGDSEEVLLSGNPNACLDVQDNIDTLIGITTSTIGSGSTAGLPSINLGFFNQSGIGTTSSPGGFKCARDLGFLHTAVAEDVWSGGNKNIVGFALSYFDPITGDPISDGLLGEESESVTAFTALGDLSRAAVTNQLNAQDLTLTPDYETSDNRSPESCADVQDLIENLVGIATVTVGLGTTTVLPLVNSGFDERDNIRYRFFDSYRLIQNNKQEIIDRSIGEIAVEYDNYDTFFFPGDDEENERSRFYDAYRLIQKNKDVIVGLAFTDAVNEPSFVGFDFNSVMDKCKRDTAFFIDAISLDALTGGNAYSREFTLQYFNSGSLITNGLDGEVSESIYVFEAATGYMKNAITNQLVGAAYSDLSISAGSPLYSVDPDNDVLNTDPTSCLDVQDNLDTLTAIVTSTLGAGNTSSLPIVNEGYFSQSVGLGTTNTPGGFKCARDVGFFVDAVSTDVFINGNRYSQEYALQYFSNGSPVFIDGSEVQPTVAGLLGAGEFIKDALTNQLYSKDLSISAGPSVYGEDTDIIPVLQSGNPDSCLDVQDEVDSLVGIVTTVLGAGSTASLSSLIYNTGIFDGTTSIGSTENPGGYKCARDLGFLVDAVSTDVFTGGNVYSRKFSEQYFNADGTPIRGGLEGEELPSLTAFDYSSIMMKKAVTNQLYDKDLTLSFGPATYGGIGTVTYNASGNPDTCLDVQGNIESLIGIVTTVIGAGTTAALYDGTIGTSNGAFYQNLGAFNQTIGFGTSAQDLIDLGAIDSPGGYKCARDIGYFVDALSTDVFIGGNTYSIEFAKQYFDVNGNPIAPGLDVERSESVTAFISAGDYMKKAISNQLYTKDLTLSFGPAIYGENTSIIRYNRSGNPETCQDVQDFIDNRIGIVTSVIGIGTLSALDDISLNPGSFLDKERKCRRDIGFIVDAIADDLENFTNKNIIDATNIYFDVFGDPLSNALVGEETETVTAFLASADYMKLSINNQLNNKDLDLRVDVAVGSNNDPDGCQNVKDTIDNLIGITTEAITVGAPTTVAVSAASTFFTANVGSGPFPHTYTSGGTVKINSIRPFDGQVVVFDKLYYQINSFKIANPGSGYINTPEIIISEPTTDWGVPAQAIANIENGRLVSVDIVSSGRGFTIPPTVTVTSPPDGGTIAKVEPDLYPTYYTVSKSTLPSSGISTVTFDSPIPYDIVEGMPVYFYKQSRVLASSHAFGYIGSGIDIKTALPQNGGVTIPENETVNLNGGLVVYTSTDQSGNFKIGDGLIINQNTGTISGTSYSKSLFSTLTPFILALGGE